MQYRGTLALVFLAIAELACGQEETPDVPFSCGPDTCHSKSQFCEVVHQGGVIDGGTTTSICDVWPPRCTATTTCDCLADAGYTGVCGSPAKCALVDGGLTLSQECP